MTLIFRRILAPDKLLLSHLIGNDEFPLAHMFPSLVCCPHLIAVFAAFLTLSMLVDAVRIQAGIVLAHDLDVCELATFSIAVGSVAAYRHGRMPKRASRVCTIGKEFAILLGSMCNFLEGRRMPTHAFAIFAGSRKRTHVVYVHGCTWWRGRRLVSIWTIFLGAFQIEFADGVRGKLGRLCDFDLHRR